MFISLIRQYIKIEVILHILWMKRVYLQLSGRVLTQHWTVLPYVFPLNQGFGKVIISTLIEISIKLCSWLHSNGIRFHFPGSEIFFFFFLWCLKMEWHSQRQIWWPYEDWILVPSSWTQKMKLGDYWSDSVVWREESALKWISGQEKEKWLRGVLCK